MSPRTRYKVAGVLAGLYAAGMSLFSHASDHSHLWGRAFNRGQSNEKQIALTFDDGPSNATTMKILGILKQHQVRATFFLIGKNVDANPSFARKIVRAGHRVGNHTFSHPNLTKLSTAGIEKEIMRAEKSIIAATGERPCLLRPPFVAYDNKVLAAAKNLRYVVIGLNVTSLDWKGSAPAQIVRQVKTHVKPNAIVLFHDGAFGSSVDGRAMVEALPKVIEWLREREYKFVTVDEMLNAFPK